MSTALVVIERPRDTGSTGRARRGTTRRRRRRPRGFAGFDVMGAARTRAEEWAATIPQTFGPDDAYRASAAAYDDARNAVRDVAWRYGGTVPPPPWPATPELVSAMNEMKIARDGFEVFAKRVPNARWPRDAGKVGPTLLRVGGRLYYELGRFQTKADAAWQKGQTLKDILNLLPDPRTVLFGSVPTWLVVGGVAWWLGRRTLRRLLG